MANRRWKRRCANPNCGAEFSSGSNGRVKCFDCSPPTARGQMRSDGKQAGYIMKNKRDVFKEHETEEDRAIEAMVKEYDRLEHLFNSNPRKWMVRQNLRQEKVLYTKRPADGWGKCQHLNPKTFDEDCIAERFADSTPFCDDHIKYYREVRNKRMSEKLAETDEKSTSINPKYYDIKNPDDAVTLLAKIGKMVEKGQMTSVKAETLIKIIDAQLKALTNSRAERLAQAKIKFMLARAKQVGKADKEPENPFDMADEEMKELESLAGEHGIQTEKQDSEEVTDNA